MRACTPGWYLQPRGVHEPLLVDGGPEVGGQRSLLGLGGSLPLAEDSNVETLKEAVKAQEKLKLRSGLRMMTQKKNQVMRRRRTERMKMTRAES